MPLDYDVDPARRLVIIRGPESIADDPDILQRIVKDPQFQRGFNFIRDRRGVIEPSEPQEVRKVVDALTAFAPHIAPCRWAVVVPIHNLVYYGMARMASMMMGDSGVQFEAFRDYREAVDWASK